MKFCYRQLVGAMLVSIAAMAMPADALAERAVVVISKDGTTREVALADVARIDIGQGKLTLHTSAGEANDLAYESLDRMLIGADMGTSSISSILKDGEIAIWPTLVTSDIHVSGVEAGSTISVYSAGGVKVASAKADDEGNASIDISGAASGVYVVSAGNHSVKIMKK